MAFLHHLQPFGLHKTWQCNQSLSHFARILADSVSDKKILFDHRWHWSHLQSVFLQELPKKHDGSNVSSWWQICFDPSEAKSVEIGPHQSKSLGPWHLALKNLQLAMLQLQVRCGWCFLQYCEVENGQSLFYSRFCILEDALSSITSGDKDK